MIKKFISWCFLIFFTYFILEGCAYAALFVLKQVKGIGYTPIYATRLSSEQRRVIKDVLADKFHYLVHSPVLGWTVKPNGEGKWLSGLYLANSKGIRSSRETEFAPPAGKIRIAAFGDSFTHGDYVNNDDTWAEKLNGMDANLEVLNFGVSGYGLDQAYLRYKEEGALFKPHIVIIGFMSEDIQRDVSVFRVFHSPAISMAMAKPRFLLQNDKLIYLKNPMPDLEDYKLLLKNEKTTLRELGKYDFNYQTVYHESPFSFSGLFRLYQILRQQFFDRFDSRSIYLNGKYNEKSEAFKVTAKLFDLFYEKALQNGAQPIIAILPNRRDFYQLRKMGTPDYQPLLDYLISKNYRTIDMLDGFDAFGAGRSVDDFFNVGEGHYAPLGNEIVAKGLCQFLKDHQLL
jgi:hypothetical protein